MKKRLVLGLLVFIALFMFTGCEKKFKPLTLEKVAEGFNNSETVIKYKEYGFELKATAGDNEFLVTSKMGDETSTITYKLVDNVLVKEDVQTSELVATAVLIDAIGVLEGYEVGEVTSNMNAFPEEYQNYTVSKDGFELVDNGDTSSFKISLNKKIKLIDLSNFYLKPEQFEMIKEIVDEKSTGNETGKIAKLAYNIEVRDDESYIYIGETKKLTQSAYKSILSALEVMYGKDIADKFEVAYPKFKKGIKKTGTFTIDSNYQMSSQDDSIFSGMKIVLVTIDNSKIKK